jgi:integrase
LQDITVYSGGQRKAQKMAIHKLSAARIAKLTKNGMYGDGGNLWLQVTNAGAAKSWVFRWTERGTGRERNMGLGPLHTIDLERARALALEYRLQLREGKDPLVERDSARLEIQIKAGLAKTAGEVAREYFDQKVARKSANWRKAAAGYLKRHVHDRIGNMPIQKINRNTILETCGLKEFWVRRHTSAVALQSLLARMFEYAKACGYYHGDNPANWAGLKHVLPLGSDVHQVEHRAALPFTDVPRFLQVLRTYEDRSNRKRGRLNVTLALEFIVLTGVRVTEVRKATWQEFDLKHMTWNVPPENRKGKRFNGKIRPIPITKPMLAVIEEMQRRRVNQSSDALVFAGSRRAEVMNVGQTNDFIHRSLKWPTKVTSHGFRSTLRDWTRANGYPPEYWDIQVDHVMGNKVSQAYGHDPLLEQRRRMMEAWGEYCSKPEPEPQSADVVKLSDKRKRRPA